MGDSCSGIPDPGHGAFPVSISLAVVLPNRGESLNRKRPKANEPGTSFSGTGGYEARAGLRWDDD